jgi:hypothetical protein
MRYGSTSRSHFKSRWNLVDLVQDHHVIPRQFKTHPIIRKYEYDINASSNIIMLPTVHGKNVLRVRCDRLVHYGPHPKYNEYVQFILNSIKTEKDLEQFVSFLKESCRYNPTQIPW